MNVTAEQADIIRATPEGGTCYLVVEGEMYADDVLGMAPRYVPPADWAALAGACETCECEGIGGTGRKLTTLTVTDHDDPLATVTVEVLPVIPHGHHDTGTRPAVLVENCDDPRTWLARDLERYSEVLHLHRQPVPNRDDVLAVTVSRHIGSHRC